MTELGRQTCRTRMKSDAITLCYPAGLNCDDGLMWVLCKCCFEVSKARGIYTLKKTGKITFWLSTHALNVSAKYSS
jgi:hypothetical protein